MRTFIANFGPGNCLWPECLDRSTIASHEDEDLRPFWEAGDREGYIAHCISNKKTSGGHIPSRQVASRWFNIAGIVSESENDLWIHREKDTVWWATSLPGEPITNVVPTFKPESTVQQVYVIHKKISSWSNSDKRGRPLMWRSLHPKARTFLSSESTLQELSPDNSRYAQALIAGAPLDAWHARPEWRAQSDATRRGSIPAKSAKELAVIRMTLTARDTAAGSGAQVTQSTKKKEFRFDSPQSMELHLRALLANQEDCCAITGLPLQFENDAFDPELICSLDRIDSDGHYEAGNLQIVCRFINRWKSDDDDAGFRRLLALLITSCTDTAVR